MKHSDQSNRNPSRRFAAAVLAFAFAWGQVAVLPLQALAEDAPAESYALLKTIKIKKDSVTILTDKPVLFNVFKVGTPPRLVVELSNTENDWKKGEVELKNNTFIDRVRSGQYQNEPTKIARVVMELKAAANFKSAVDKNAITITLEADTQAAETPATPAPEVTAEPESVENPPAQEDQAAAPAVPAEPEPAAAPSPASVKNKTAAALAQAKKTVIASVPEQAEKSKENALRSSESGSLFGNQSVTLDFYDIDIKDLFRILAEKAGVNVVFGTEVAGTLSVQLKDVPFKNAIDTILTLKNLRMVILGDNIVQVMTPAEFDTYKTNAISITKIFPINYAKATNVELQLAEIQKTLGGKGKSMVDDRTNSIIVTDTPEGIEAAARLIVDLDKPTPQVMIEAKIIQVQIGRSLDLGIQWGVAYTDQSGNQMVSIGATKQATGDASPTAETPGSGAIGLQTRSALTPSGASNLEAGGTGFSAGQGLGLAFGFVKDVVRLNAQLNALAQKNKSKLLSNPKVATLNNQKATIKSETSDPYITSETQLTNAGTLTSQKINLSLSGVWLDVTPTINADGRITMLIVPDITSSQPTSIGVPKTTKQHAETTVIVKNGETFVIGGLISEMESDEKSYVPILGSIPILGHLFKKTGTRRSRAELLVFVTPTIVPY